MQFLDFCIFSNTQLFDASEIQIEPLNMIHNRMVIRKTRLAPVVTKPKITENVLCDSQRKEIT